MQGPLGGPSSKLFSQACFSKSRCGNTPAASSALFFIHDCCALLVGRLCSFKKNAGEVAPPTLVKGFAAVRVGALPAAPVRHGATNGGAMQCMYLCILPCLHLHRPIHIKVKTCYHESRGLTPQRGPTDPMAARAPVRLRKKKARGLGVCCAHHLRQRRLADTSRRPSTSRSHTWENTERAHLHL